jgi:hypothetical protein
MYLQKNSYLLRQAIKFLQTPVHIAPLVTFRVAIGAMMVFSTLRFWWLGWIDDHYIKPIVHFKYFGFEWVEVLPPDWMYALHAMMIVSALCVMLGLYFRIASVFLFLSFIYTELIDLTYYLNHYYFVSLVLLLLIFTPAHKYFSLDALRTKQSQIEIPRVYIFIFQLLLAIVYLYAGLAKLNYTWLFEALPLKIWLPANDKLPLIGWLFTLKAMPYIFSWVGMLYDCTIVFWLLNHRTRPWAYVAVIIFHMLTGLLFQIGVFPLVMIAATLIFFSEQWHVRLLNLFLPRRQDTLKVSDAYTPAPTILLVGFVIFFMFQLIFPWRYVLYPGNLFWTEEGYRFSWRVMLMEKAGTATFYVKDSKTNREGMVVNNEFLNPHQEKQMAMQPDMIVQFAHFLKQHYQQQGVTNPSVRAEVYVTLNAKPSQLLIDSNVDLTTIRDTWKPKPWILPVPK